MRISGPEAFPACEALAGTLPSPRRAVLRRLRDQDEKPLDNALVTAFPGPASATGEDLVELHLHGGRAVVRRVLDVLAAMPGLRGAEAGEFTRRSMMNGRIDLAEAEGLADLLAAESEVARRAALIAVEGGVSRRTREWSERLTTLSARLEAQIDFADEDDLPAEAAEMAAIAKDMAILEDELAAMLAQPPVERLRDGFRIVLAGPPNAGKSSLINALADREVAIATPVPGTTRDRLEAPVLRNGVSYLLTDTAGLRDDSSDPIERIGIERAIEAIEAADLVIWLGDDAPPEQKMLAINARCDEEGRAHQIDRLSVSAKTGAGIDALWREIAERIGCLLPLNDAVVLNSRQRARLLEAVNELRNGMRNDPIIIAESLRLARTAISGITGYGAIDSVLDDLFGRFCIGK